jgi:uncharacterized protein (TIGR02147 family)
MTNRLFDFNDYKAYLISRLDGDSGLGKGGRAQFCSAMGCQSAYLSQVLNGSANLSLDQGDAINRLLNHSDDECDFFLLLIQLSRAGTASFRRYTEDRIDLLRHRQRKLKHRFQVPEKLKLADMMRYFSSWKFSAVHILTTIPEFRDRPSIASRLGLSDVETAEILEFLTTCGLLNRKESAFEATTLRLHLGEDSPLVARSHLNWRLQAMRSIEAPREENVHYSSVATLSKDDIERIRERLIREIETVKTVVKDSPAEEIYCFSLDWFKV